MKLLNSTGILILALLAGCATLPRNPVPTDLVFEADVVGADSVRAWGGIVSPALQADLVASHGQEVAGAFPQDEYGLPVYDVLALSGGGATGAFGAGFLNGWTAAGTRPSFKMVSGISTGALIAPFAFLGREYDEQLKTVFTTVDTESILERLNFFSILFRSESLATTEPLKKLVENHLDDALIRKVADRHNQGYRLYIGTHHMDAQRLVVWNMGLIANSDQPEAADLFRQVILASASIPIAFPPVMIQTEANGRRYDEMHVDGGVSVQVFFYAGTLDINTAMEETGVLEGAPPERKKGSLYIIRNGQLSSSPEQIDRELPEITGRAIDSMIKISAVGDLFRIYTFADRDGLNFNYVGVPPDYVAESSEAFDKAEMNRLFNIGYEMGLSGAAWQKKPPGL